MNITAGAAWLNASFAGFDESVTLAVHRIYESCGSWLTPIMEFISLLGKGGIFLIFFSLFLLFRKPSRRFGTAMAIGLALGALVVNVWLKVWIARPRPYVDVNSIYYPLWIMLGSHTESDFSFPSGHTNAAFATMIPLFLIGKKNWSWIAIVFGILMGISRIYLVVHFPSDVLGGILSGTITGIIGTIIASKLPEKWYQWNIVRQRPKKKGAHE